MCIRDRIEIAIPVIIKKRRCRTPGSILETGSGCLVRKSAIAIVQQECIGTIVRHIDVEIAIVVDVADRGTVSVTGVGKTGCIRHFLEQPLFVLTKQSIGSRCAERIRQRCRWAMADLIDVQISIVVKIE